MTTDLSRVSKLFDMSSGDLVNLQFSMDGMVSRIDNTIPFLTESEMAHFAATRANDLKMTEPRLAKIEDFEADFRRLFKQLVETPILK